jgi:hypothetical protein
MLTEQSSLKYSTQHVKIYYIASEDKETTRSYIIIMFVVVKF